jgi:hypothetical protein
MKKAPPLPPEPARRAAPAAGVLLNRHTGQTFRAQTVYLAGNGYENCAFEGCTIVVTNAPFVLNGCRMNNCNWRIEYDLLWGDPAHRQRLRELVQLIDGAGSVAPAPAGRT